MTQDVHLFNILGVCGAGCLVSLVVCLNSFVVSP